MKIVFDSEKGICIFENNYTVDLTKKEKTFIDYLFNILSSSIDMEKLGIIKKSASYTTITYTNKDTHDLIRFKLTDLTMWASVFITKENAILNKDNPVFAAQKNKNQLYWKATLKSPTDCNFLKPFIIDAIKDFI